MSKQRRQDTAPEMAIRRILHGRGFRYRVTWPVPGLRRRTMDIAFTRARLAVFVDGCFWHGCPLRHKGAPTANGVWWQAKLARNQERDRETDRHLQEAGWVVVRVWEHESPGEAVDRIVSHLAAPASSAPHVDVEVCDVTSDSRSRS